MLYRTQFGTPLGLMHAVAGEAGVVVCDFHDRRDMDNRLASLAGAVDRPNGHLLTLRREMDAYFAGSLREFTVALTPAGSDFELKAWDYLRTIPFGQTRTYGQQAKAIATIEATRAVGRANGRNFISIVIPCHRVIAANGELTGYGGGVDRKRWLLDHEARFAPQADSLFAQHTHAAGSII